MIFSYQPQALRTSPIYVLWYSFCGKLYATNGDDEEEGRNGTEALFSLCTIQSSVTVVDRIFSDCNIAQVLFLAIMLMKKKSESRGTEPCTVLVAGMEFHVRSQHNGLCTPPTQYQAQILVIRHFFFINPELCSRLDGNTGSTIKL